MKLKDKVALITGAASGIGKEIAIEFAREGAKVCIADLSVEAANACAQEINAAGGSAMAVQMNVTDEAQVDAGFAKTVETFGGVDVMISNAGIQIISPIVDLKYEDWKRLMAIHADGAFLTTRAAMRAMIAAKRGGTILLMGSVHSHDALCHCQAWPDRTGQGGRQGGGCTWHSFQCDLPRLRAHTAGRQADSGAGENPRHF